MDTEDPIYEELSDQECIDRVAARLLKNRGPEPEVLPPCKFACEQCGGDDFDVIITEETHAFMEKEAPCTCGKCSETRSPAAVKSVTSFRLQYGGRTLCPDHTFFHIKDSAVDPSVAPVMGTSWTRLHVNCEECASRAMGAPEAFRVTATGQNITRDYCVRCTACKHQIEHGWEGPIGQGTIWPCEASDFDPAWLTPDPKYHEAWARRGWTKPDEEE